MTEATAPQASKSSSTNGLTAPIMCPTPYADTGVVVHVSHPYAGKTVATYDWYCRQPDGLPLSVSGFRIAATLFVEVELLGLVAFVVWGIWLAARQRRLGRVVS